MEMIKTTGFCDMTNDELQNVDGGSISFGIGIGVAVFVTGLSYVYYRIKKKK